MPPARALGTAVLSLGLALAAAQPVAAEPVAVRFKEGLVRGLLSLRTLDGEPLADGDLFQIARGDLVTARLAFRFKDGSRSEETTVFSQRRTFRLVSDHLVQKGPAFPKPMDVTIDARAGRVTVVYRDDDGHEKTAAERLDLPPDTANGLILTLLKNLAPGAAGVELSLVAATPKPRLVKLKVSAAGEEAFSTGATRRKATHYLVHVDVGGVTGILADLLGKQPPDSHVWILGGGAPAFVRSESPLYVSGPLWRIELTSPVWPDRTAPGR